MHIYAFFAAGKALVTEEDGAFGGFGPPITLLWAPHHRAMVTEKKK